MTKITHAAAASLLAWTLVAEVPKAIPRNCANCGYTLDQSIFVKRGFATKESCEDALQDWQEDFLRGLDKKGLVQVTNPPPPRCVPDGEPLGPAAQASAGQDLPESK